MPYFLTMEFMGEGSKKQILVSRLRYYAHCKMKIVFDRFVSRAKNNFFSEGGGHWAVNTL